MLLPDRFSGFDGFCPPNLHWMNLSSDGRVSPGPTVTALGNFDGLHVAHKLLLRTVVDKASASSAVPAVFTFRGSKSDALIGFDEKMQKFADLGIQLAGVADFSRIRDLSPEAFFDQILIAKLRASHLICGYNFRFGKDASGDTDTLRRLCEAHGVELTVLSPVIRDGEPVSSTRIRAALRGGNPETAARLLGTPYALSGAVAHGRTVGRQNNCPTLNLTLPEGRVVPRFGVYFTRCTLGGRVYPAVANIGVRPTFTECYGTSEILCEVHLLGDLSGLAPEDGLYGLPIRVELDRFCRPEKKFDSPVALYEQIARDVEEATRFYRIPNPNPQKGG